MYTVANILRWRRSLVPDNPAITDGGLHTSYRELDQASNRVANALISAGLNRGERVCVLDVCHLGVFEVIFGIAKAGGVFTPINWRLAPAEIAYVIKDAAASIVFVGGTIAPALAAAMVDCQEARVVTFSGSQKEAGWIDYTSFRDEGDTQDPHRDAQEDETVFQLYTSGTTGYPKGAELTNRGLCMGGTMCLSAFSPITESDATLICMPLYHIAGAGYAIGMIFCGTRLVLLGQADPGAILDLIEKERINLTFLVPALINFILQHPKCGETDFSSLKYIAYGASPIPEELLVASMRVFGCGFVQAYGLTETTGGVVLLPNQDHYPGNPRLKSCGLPIFGHTVRIVDPMGKPCAPGDVGEITINGGMVMKGYWNQPEANAQNIRNGWFYTGDAGYMDEDGYVYIHDRVKDMIISGGENIYPAEVESALFAHAEVVDVAVIGIPDKKWGETVKAVVVRAPGSRLSEAALIEFCRERLAHFKCPTSVDFTETLPRNPSGKLLKRVLREPYWEGQQRQVH